MDYFNADELIDKMCSEDVHTIQVWDKEKDLYKVFEFAGYQPKKDKDVVVNDAD